MRAAIAELRELAQGLDPAILREAGLGAAVQSLADRSPVPVAVEYITYKGPAALEGHLFNFLGTPNRYGLPALFELHVWAWRPNMAGPFADMNMDASCAAMAAPAK